MGDSAHYYIILRFSAMGRDTNLLDCLYPEIQFHGDEFEAIRSLIHAKIKQEESSSSLEAESNNPALLGELLSIAVSLSANENINAVSLCVILVSDGSNEQSNAGCAANIATRARNSMRVKRTLKATTTWAYASTGSTLSVPAACK